jgi:hypothetical protein
MVICVEHRRSVTPCYDATVVKPPRNSTGTFVRWRLVTPHADEACRWECVDQRWVALRLGKGTQSGQVIVADSTGRETITNSYDEALNLARSWRT